MRKHPGCSISESVVKRDVGLTADDVFLGIRAAGVLHARTLLHSSEVLRKQIVGLRNRLIHGYDQVNLDILWAIVQSDLPPLLAELNSALDELEDAT